MSIALTTLSNGIRVVSHRFAHVETVSLGVYVATGARHESLAEHGISHLLEHMAFKGTRQRTARRIAEEIEAVGGDLNAATSLETTAYYARVLKGDEEVAIDILADILQNSLFAEDDLERERKVILQEIAGIDDSPDDLGYDLIHEAAFPDQPAGRPIIGTKASVKRIQPDDLRRFLAERYVGPSIVVAAAGALDHDRLVRHVEARFGGLSSDPVPREQAAVYGGGRRWSAKPFEQAHLLIGFESPRYGDSDFFAAQVFSGLFGGGMSSRLFQEVREARGLCYAIYSTAFAMSDAGLMVVHAATGPEMMGDLIGVIGAEFRRATEEPPAAAEIQRAKAQIKTSLLMRLVSTSSRAEQMARQIALLGRLLSTEELIERIDAVDAAATGAVARRILAGDRPSVAVVGAGKASARLAAEAERVATA